MLIVVVVVVGTVVGVAFLDRYWLLLEVLLVCCRCC